MQGCTASHGSGVEVLSMTNNISRLFVGIDSSKKTNQCCIVDESGNRLKEICVANNLSGANKIEHLITEFARNLDIESVKIGTEATDFYDFHILEFLASGESNVSDTTISL